MRKNLKNSLTSVGRPIRKDRKNSWCLAGVILFLMLACTSNDTAHEHNTYTCPMHPTVVLDGPGTCPVCGMDLVRKDWAGKEIEITEDLSKLLRSTDEAVLASVKTVRGEYKSVPVSVEAQGIVNYDSRKIYKIAARVGGRLEKIYLTYPFQQVTRGQKVAEIYSPELVTAQRELMFLLESDPENYVMINQARKKLELLGMTSSQINDLSRLEAPESTVGIYSPYSGYLITDAEAGSSTPNVKSTGPPEATPQMRDGMSRASSRSGVPSSGAVNEEASVIREGDYVTAGQTLFTIVDTNALRIELDLPGAHIGNVSPGTRLQLNFGDEKNITASVDFVQPFFTEGQNFLKVRVYTSETEHLRIGQLVNAIIFLKPIEALWVPQEAVVDLGVQKVVFVKEREILKPKVVTVGAASNGMLEIRSGLASSDEIAASAQYLVDSENLVRTESSQ
jgi:multidrug efflux pump subunit AcrA (membrane-fusion protein)